MILNCPFCNSKAEIRVRTGYSDFDWNQKFYDVMCTNINCYLQDGADWWMETEEEAVKLWNTRDGNK